MRATVYRPDIGGAAAAVRRRPLRGLRRAAVPGAQRRGGRRATSTPTWPPCARSPARARPDVALANHLVMGPGGPRAGARRTSRTRSRSTAARWSTSVKPHRARFRPYAVEGLAGARGVLVGSRHTAESLWTEMDDPSLPGAHAARPARASTSSASRRAPGALRGPARSRRLAALAPDRGHRLLLRPRPAARPSRRWTRVEPRGPAGRVRRQADRVQGRRAAARRVAAGAGARAARAAADRRLRGVPGGLESLAAALAAGDLDALRARCAARTAASCRSWRAYLDGRRARSLRLRSRGLRRPPRRTTRWPTCCPPPRRWR